MSFWFPYLQYWLIGWPVLWRLISCVMQIKWHWFPPKRFIGQILPHLPQVQLSLESGHTQALSHYRLGIQSHTSNIFHKFPVGNLECTGQHQGCSCGSQQSVEEQSVYISTDLVGMLGIPEFSWFGLGSFNATWLVDITAKKAGIKYVLVVEHSEYKLGRTVSMSTRFPYR